eukprot:TRINITY_DN768_c0_g1_i1.p2 TRINITY_DN768_c0_g1~~TRINITY_DN768_c0_g1_i1.p2  ORF type:complete len:292 (+),score=73.44 TRINITY_DN768_c0_g1_i1:156-1031(+)
MAADEEKEEKFYDEESEEEESEWEDEDVPTTNKREDAVYNADGLHEKLEEIGWPDDIHWTEKLSCNYKFDQKIDINDDLAREMAFYTQALECSRDAYEKFLDLGVPFLRPPDYYAEMIKSDSHMLKVKDKLLVQKKRMEEADERRKAREAKKLAKAVQAEKLKERAQQKKNDIEAVKKWRKLRQKSGFAPLAKGGSEMPFSDDDEEKQERGVFSKKKPVQRGVAPGDRSGGKGNRNKGFKGKGKRSREFKNSKFGHGGPRRLKKQNTADSTAGFSARDWKRGDRPQKKRKF